MIPGAGPMESGFSLSAPWPQVITVWSLELRLSLHSLSLGDLAQSCVPECSPVIHTEGRGYV